jgi:hypothetical protein
MKLLKKLNITDNFVKVKKCQEVLLQRIMFKILMQQKKYILLNLISIYFDIKY